MTEAWSNIIETLVDRLQVASDQLIHDSEETGEMSITEFVSDHFWSRLLFASKKIHNEVTKICMALSKLPYPNAEETKCMATAVELASFEVISVFSDLPKNRGAVLSKEVYTGVLNILENVVSVFKSMKFNGPKVKKERLKHTACVWEACDELEKLSRDNVQAVCKILKKEQLLVRDALHELEEEIKGGQETSLDDESDTWNSEELDMLPPCLGLIKTVCSSLKRIHSLVSTRGNCDTTNNIAELDSLAVVTEELSPAVDDFAASLYPPFDRNSVRSYAIGLVHKIKAVLELSNGGHFIAEEDLKWIDFLLKAVDHNYDKLQLFLDAS